MRIGSRVAHGWVRAGRSDFELSGAARRRLKWLDYYRHCGNNARLTCRHFDISPQTFYRWWRRYDARDLCSLENRSRRPKRTRRPSWSAELEGAVLGLRQRYPRWGKDKLQVLLRRQGRSLSVSMVGRILTRLKQRGLLVEPQRAPISVRRPRPPRPYAVRKPKDYVPRQPGDLVQIDTLDVRPLPGMVFKHFTARDLVSRWDVIEVHRQATAHIAAGFLDTVCARMPFALRAVQVDDGGEFRAGFEEACRARGVRLFVLPPRSPKLNGAVERAQRTHTEEFYEIHPFEAWTVAALNRQARGWERIYNTIRPHQALAYKTPLQFLAERCAHGREADASRPNCAPCADEPGSRDASGAARSAVALDAGSPRAP
ncbi:MAG TPA: integrase core domain-containing protein [Candidatus Acidoferrales bacterium]|nr:integrase core domain-containing protein [Candidatus Acidoferrales bacterium]